jgi:hypothetical protein
VCPRITTTPPLPGATGSATISGSGTNVMTEFVTDASGQASITLPVGVQGPYSLIFQLGGLTRATTIFVGAIQGTCPPPSTPCEGTIGACGFGCGAGSACCPLLGPGVCACEPQRMIDVIFVGGRCLPVSQLVQVTGPECTSGGTQLPHWHARTGFVIATDGTIVTDVNDCGYALVSDVQVEQVEHCDPCID